jgi:hypothetical protein
VRAEG